MKNEIYELHVSKNVDVATYMDYCFKWSLSLLYSYNIPELAKKYKVYALDILGFGWSEKALIEYDALVCRDQVVDFVKEIVKEPTVLVGTSLGGLTALVVAALLEDQVKGVVLLNSAGQFGDAIARTAQSESEEENVLQKFVLKPLKETFQQSVS